MLLVLFTALQYGMRRAICCRREFIRAIGFFKSANKFAPTKIRA